LFIYFILNKKGKFLGFTTDKKLLDLFLYKRGEKNYKIKKVKKNKLNKSFLNQLEVSFSEYELLCYDDNIPVFDYEETRFAESLHQFFIDLEISITDLKEAIKFFRFSSDEEKKIKNSIEKYLDIIKIIKDEDYGITESEFTYIDREKMIAEYIRRHS